MIPFLLLVSLARASPSRTGDNRGKFLIKRLFFDNFMLGVAPSCRSWGRCISFFYSFCKWLQQIQHGVFHFFFSLKISFGFREVNGWYWLLFGNCNHGDEVFDIAFDYFLTCWKSVSFSCLRRIRAPQSTLWTFGHIWRSSVFAAGLDHVQRWKFDSELCSLQTLMWESHDSLLWRKFSFERKKSFPELVLGRCSQYSQMATVAFSLSDSFSLPFASGLVDRFFFCECVNGESFPMLHLSFLKYLQCGWCHYSYSRSWLQFPPVQLKHGGRAPFPESLSSGLLGRFPLPFPSFPCHVRKNIFSFWSTSLLTSKIHTLLPFFQLHSKSMLLLLCLLIVLFEKSTCSAVAARGCHWPQSSIFGSSSAPFSAQCLADVVSSHASWV